MNDICHIEFNVTDLDRAQAFYEGMFGWTFQSFMGGQMRTFGLGEKHLGGLMLVEEVGPGASPSVWFQVESVDAMCAKAASLGGALGSPKMDVPGVGWSAQVKDLDGNLVGLVEFTSQE